MVVPQRNHQFDANVILYQNLRFSILAIFIKKNFSSSFKTIPIHIFFRWKN